MLNNANIFLFLFLLNQLNSKNSSYLVYELNSLKPKNIIEYYLSFNSTYTTLEVGTPSQNVDFYFTLEHHEVSLTNQNCRSNNLFYPSKSSTFKEPFNIQRRESNGNHEFVYVDKLNV